MDANVAFQSGFTGNGIGIAIIDSGINPHADLLGRIVYSESFVAGDPTTLDYYGHGTHVAGIAAGSGAVSEGPGVHADAARIGARCTSDQSEGAGRDRARGTDSAVIAAIGRAIQLKSQYNIRIINLSLGRPIVESYKLDPLCQAVEQAWKAGIFVAVAAGNDGRLNVSGNNGYGTINSPGNDPYVITVGAMKTERRMPTATISSRVIAPRVRRCWIMS